MSRKRKIAQRALIVSRMERAFVAVYHNATIHAYGAGPKDIEEYLSDDKQWEELSFHFSSLIDDVNGNAKYKEHGYIDQYIAREYGVVCTYGRGGATCAPEQWMSRRNSSSAAIPVTDDMGRPAILKLALDVEDWNDYVKAECSKESIDYVLRYAYDQAKESAMEELAEKVERLVRIS
jgi:hypothetical protein